MMMLELTPYDQRRQPRPVAQGRAPVFVDLEALKADVSCAICMEIMSSTAMTLECSHRFCKECVERWIREKGGTSTLCHCPTCRNKINTRRSLREDAKLDSLISALFGPNITALEEAEAKMKASAGPRRPNSSLDRALDAILVTASSGTPSSAQSPKPVQEPSSHGNKRQKILSAVPTIGNGEDILFVLRKHPLEQGPPVTRKQYIRASVRLQVRHMLQFLAQQQMQNQRAQKRHAIVYFDGMGTEHALREEDSVEELLARFSITRRAADLVLHYKQVASA